MRLTPQIALRGNEAVFLDLTRSKHLVREETLPLKLEAIARRLGVPSPRVATAPSAGAALAQARSGDHRPERWPLEVLLDFALPFESSTSPSGAHARSAELLKILEVLETLRKLGLSRASDFLKLPSEQLLSRLGKESLETLQLMRGESVTLFPTYRPPEQIQESISLLDAETSGFCGENLDALLFFAKRALDCCLARLRARALRLSSFELVLVLERGDPRAWNLELAIAQGSTRAVLPILRERLDRDLAREPLDASVTELRCRVRETAPGYGSQRDLFCSREEQMESRDAFFARVAARLGHKSVFFATEVDRHAPESAWQRALPQAPPSASLWRPRLSLPRRPLRLFEPPQALREIGGVIQTPSGRRHSIIRSIGPERLRVEWWGDRPISRDYFELIGDQGERLWVFRESGGSLLYLHGYFD